MPTSSGQHETMKPLALIKMELSSLAKKNREEQIINCTIPYADDFIYAHAPPSNLCQRQLHSSLKGTTWRNTLGLTQGFKTVPNTYSKDILRQRFEGPGCSTDVYGAYSLAFEISICCVIPDDRTWSWPYRDVIGI